MGLVNDLINKSIVAKSEPPRDSWSLGTVSKAPTAGKVDVVIDGDTVATSMAYTTAPNIGDRVVILLLGTVRMVLAVIGDTDGTELFCDEAKKMAGAVWLSETAANFRKFDLYLKTSNGHVGFASVYKPDGRIVDLSCDVRTSGGVKYSYLKTVLISGTTINTYIPSGETQYWTGLWGSDGTNSYGDYLNIFRVVGYR